MILLALNNNAWDFLLILFIFVLVLLATYYVTKWAANYQKTKGMNGNIELLESMALGANKFVEIVRVGDTYYALVACKDTVTLLGEISKEQLKDRTELYSNTSFKEILQKVTKKEPEGTQKPKDATDDESTML